MQALPDSIVELKRLLAEREAAHAALLAERDAALAAAHDRLRDRDALIEALKLQIDKLKRQRFGRSSERLEREILQLEFELGLLQADPAAPLPAALKRSAGDMKARPVRKPLPQHLPREDAVHAVDGCCAGCGGALVSVGEDVAEVLEYVPARFKVIRHVRPKCACRSCGTLIQAPAPERPIAGGLAGPGLLAHVAVAKYLDHLPLYRKASSLPVSGSNSTARPWHAG